MRRFQMYTHPRFMDVNFLVLSAGFYGSRWKLKVDWFSKRGPRLGVTQKLELSREKALEFTEVEANGK